MNDATSVPLKSPKQRRALSVWELPKLLRSVHCYRKPSRNPSPIRPHFRAILAFVHRNRFVVASQVQRRFTKFLKSDRTARRHLAEMESLGLLDVVITNNVSPLWPKVYFVTRRGLTRLRQALHDQGHDWSESLRDRRRSDGSSAQHVLHELFITEFLLSAWEATEQREDLQILSTQRRSLAKHGSFNVVISGRRTRLEPDAMFLCRQEGKGMMCCFVEMDLDSMTLRQMEAKFRRYQAWGESPTGMDFIKRLYQRNGANNPATAFRILLVVGSPEPQAEFRRVASLLNVMNQLPTSVKSRIWMTGVQHIRGPGQQQRSLTESIWIRQQNISTAGRLSAFEIPKIPLHALFE